jgi:hypothetical protein
MLCAHCILLLPPVVMSDRDKRDSPSSFWHAHHAHDIASSSAPAPPRPDNFTQFAPTDIQSPSTFGEHSEQMATNPSFALTAVHNRNAYEASNSSQSASYDSLTTYFPMAPRETIALPSWEPVTSLSDQLISLSNSAQTAGWPIFASQELPSATGNTDSFFTSSTAGFQDLVSVPNGGDGSGSILSPQVTPHAPSLASSYYTSALPGLSAANQSSSMASFPSSAEVSAFTMPRTQKRTLSGSPTPGQRNGPPGAAWSTKRSRFDTTSESLPNSTGAVKQMHSTPSLVSTGRSQMSAASFPQSDSPVQQLPLFQTHDGRPSHHPHSGSIEAAPIAAEILDLSPPMTESSFEPRQIGMGGGRVGATNLLMPSSSIAASELQPEIVISADHEQMEPAKNLGAAWVELATTMNSSALRDGFGEIVQKLTGAAHVRIYNCFIVVSAPKQNDRDCRPS